MALFGGIAIGLTLWAGLWVFRVFAGIEALVVCGALMFAAGLADDLFALKPFAKLVVQIAIASVLLFWRWPGRSALGTARTVGMPCQVPPPWPLPWGGFDPRRRAAWCWPPARCCRPSWA